MSDAQPITGLRPGQIAEHVFLCGDPARVEKLAAGWKQAREVCSVREYRVVPGERDGVPVSAASTGIGAPGTAGIAVTGITRCSVTNNIVHHIGYTGIGITGEKGKQVSPHIFRNITYRNMGGGIGSMRGSTAIVEENICFENFYAGIGHENANPLVINNTCYKNVRAGIGIREEACTSVRGKK